ncbi:MAG: cytochrome P450 [Thermoanaerobaculia bacterium]|nr:cytochrome P450 [Thermoanaerobaculia bacterium]
MKLDVEGRRLRLNPRDPAFYQDPYPSYGRILKDCPVVFWEEFERWCFFGHRQVDTILRSRRFGRSMAQIEGAVTREPILEVDRHSLLDMEPPSHTRLRRLVQGAFIARRIEELRPRIERLCHELIDQIERRHEVDLLATYATPIPVVVIAELLGVPTQMSQQLLDWSHAMVAVYELGPTDEQIVEARRSADEFVRFLRGYVERRRRDPRDDLLSQLIAAEEDGDRLTEDELISTCILLLNAGHEATVNVIGNGALALLRHPDQLSKWRSRPDLTRSAVEELLRYDTPLHVFHRWVLEDQVVHVPSGGELELPQGTEVSLVLGAANHDPAVFHEPECIDLARSKNPHLSFGGGLHYCLGAPLARLELQIAIPILLERLPALELDSSAGEPSWKNTYHFRGLDALWVRP